MPRVCEVYPGICLTTEEKARKTLSQGSRRMPAGKEYTEQFKASEAMYQESPLLWGPVLGYWLFVIQHSKNVNWSHLQRLLSDKDHLPHGSSNFIR